VVTQICTPFLVPALILDGPQQNPFLTAQRIADVYAELWSQAQQEFGDHVGVQLYAQILRQGQEGITGFFELPGDMLQYPSGMFEVKKGLGLLGSVAIKKCDEPVEVLSRSLSQVLLEKIRVQEATNEKLDDASASDRYPFFRVFSPDGLHFAALGGDLARSGRVKVRNLDHKVVLSLKPDPQGERVQSLAFSPDSKWLVTGLSNRSFIFDLKGKQIKALRWHRSIPISFAFFPENERIAVGCSDHSIEIWNYVRGRDFGTRLTGHKSPVKDLRISPNGLWLISTSEDGQVKRWKIAKIPLY
jgi:WD40 repeat protein